ncbi:MAG: hypothetical protein Q9222_007769 [Ikaeria aurantiellina]
MEKIMAHQERPASGIPRPSRLPVRSSPIKLPPQQLDSQSTSVKKGNLDSITVAKSRPFKDPSYARLQAPQLSQVVPGSTKDEVFAAVLSPPGFQTPRKDSDRSSADIKESDLQKDEAKAMGRKPRPSLSDRAIQSLSSIPPSPSPRRRQSGFFPADSPAIRPPSSMGRSRPVTSAGFYPPLPTSRPTSPSKRPTAPRPNVLGQDSTPQKTTYGGRGLNRPTIESFNSRDGGSFAHSRKVAKASHPAKPTSKASRSSNRDDMTRATIRDNPSSTDTGAQADSAPLKSNLKSSNALRETIANARAARRAAPKYEAKDTVKPIHRGFDNIRHDEDGTHMNILHKRINDARSDGKLNISGMGLKSFPKEVLEMYDPAKMTSGPTWYESVDLVRLNAADNEMEDLNWDSPFENSQDVEDEPPENIFATLQHLDLHGNRLSTLPINLRDLQHLTVLNLSRNQLQQTMSEVFDTISSTTSLRELYLAENSFSGSLPPPFHWPNLEVLDIHSNGFTDLLEELSRCKALRQLNVSANKIQRFPCVMLPNLKSLNISSNHFAVEDLVANLTAPQLTDLDISACRISSLPAFPVHFPRLKTVIAFDNRISTIEVDSVRGLEVLDLKGNDIRSLPAELSLLGLQKFLVAGNPMRAPRREILEGTTERLMEWLRGRLPAGAVDDEIF